jgi:hypothetical protein
MKSVRLVVFVVIAFLTTAAWFETDDSREKNWKKDPWAGFRRTWYFHHFEYYPREARETTMLRVGKNEIEQGVMRTEATLGRDKQRTEWKTLKYTVRAAGLTKNDEPVVEILLTELDVVWIAVLSPRDKKMKLYIGGFYVGEYSNE